MQKYLDYAIYWDFALSVLVALCVFWGKPLLEDFLRMPTPENMAKFAVTLITVSATLIGFLLTIITVLVTFKKGFQDNEGKKKDEDKKVSNEVPKTTVFDEVITKEQRFYASDLHKKVVDIFINATYEIGSILLFLLILQFGNCNLSILWITLVSLSSLIIVVLSIVRSLYMFRLFLNVHLHEKEGILEKFNK
jgi:hypothetical protein